jgi:hypothetical protein
VWYIGINNSVYATCPSGGEWTSIKLRSGQYVEVNGEQTPINSGSVRADIGMGLFLRNGAAHGLSVTSIIHAKIRLFRLYTRSGALLRDMIPVRKDGVGYMFDRVSGQLFGNSGSGAFVLGPDKR